MVCNNCGKEQNSEMANSPRDCVGRFWKTCSLECHREIEYKQSSYILGRSYDETAAEEYRTTGKSKGI